MENYIKWIDILKNKYKEFANYEALKGDIKLVIIASNRKSVGNNSKYKGKILREIIIDGKSKVLILCKVDPKLLK